MGISYFKYFFHDLKKYRHYVAYSVKSNLKAELSNTVLGYLWWLLDPMLHMLVYTFLVQVLFQRGTPAFPVYVFAALLPWKVATSAMMQSADCIRSNAGIIKQVYLPKFVLPLIGIATNSIKLLFGFVVLFGMMVVYGIEFTWHIVEVLPVLAVFLLFYYSISIFLTHFGVLFKDMRYLLNYLIMFWFFGSPGIWTLDRLPLSWQEWIWLNPNVAFFMSFRNVFMYGESPYYKWLAIWVLVALFFLLIGIPNLYRSDKNYTKVI